MTKNKAASILRLVGILIIFLGLILATLNFFQINMANSLTQSGFSFTIKGALGGMGLYGYLATMSVAAWGYGMFRTSNILGTLVASE